MVLQMFLQQTNFIFFEYVISNGIPGFQNNMAVFFNVLGTFMQFFTMALSIHINTNNVQESPFSISSQARVILKFLMLRIFMGVR
jgi:hypothetical protein